MVNGIRKETAYLGGDDEVVAFPAILPDSCAHDFLRLAGYQVEVSAPCHLRRPVKRGSKDRQTRRQSAKSKPMPSSETIPLTSINFSAVEEVDPAIIRSLHALKRLFYTISKLAFFLRLSFLFDHSFPRNSPPPKGIEFHEFPS